MPCQAPLAHSIQIGSSSKGASRRRGDDLRCLTGPQQRAGDDALEAYPLACPALGQRRSLLPTGRGERKIGLPLVIAVGVAFGFAVAQQDDMILVQVVRWDRSYYGMAILI